MNIGLIKEKFVHFSLLVSIFTILNLTAYIFLQDKELFFWLCVGNASTSFILALFKN